MTLPILSANENGCLTISADPSPNTELDLQGTLTLNTSADFQSLLNSVLKQSPKSGAPILQYNIPVYKEVPIRKNKKRRIQKKWIKKYGTKSIVIGYQTAEGCISEYNTKTNEFIMENLKISNPIISPGPTLFGSIGI